MKKQLNKQDQKAQDGSIAIQASGNVTINGLSYSDVKQICDNVWNENFLKLSIKAMEIANYRANNINDRLIQRLQQSFPNFFEKAEDPDFQYGVFTIQKEYARSGDDNIAELLIDILVERCKHKERNLIQIVLNESLSTISKLTKGHLAILSLVFALKYSLNNHILSHPQLGEYFDTHILPFAEKVVNTPSSFQHLDYCGCGSVIVLGDVGFEKIMSSNYQGLFLNGFEKDVLIKRDLDLEKYQNFFTPCLNDPQKLQINAINKDILEKKLGQCTIKHPEDKVIYELFDIQLMSPDQIRQKCISIRPYMKKFIDLWNDSEINQVSLTSVGIAIACANLKRHNSETYNLGIWIK